MNKNQTYNILKKGMLLLWMATMTLAINAVPAKPGLVRTLKLSDGTTVQARLVGDEHGHYWLSSNGKAYRSEGNTEIFRSVDIQSVKKVAETRRKEKKKGRQCGQLYRQEERHHHPCQFRRREIPVCQQQRPISTHSQRKEFLLRQFQGFDV